MRSPWTRTSRPDPRRDRHRTSPARRPLPSARSTCSSSAGSPPTASSTSAGSAAARAGPGTSTSSWREDEHALEAIDLRRARRRRRLEPSPVRIFGPYYQRERGLRPRVERPARRLRRRRARTSLPIDDQPRRCSRRRDGGGSRDRARSRRRSGSPTSSSCSTPCRASRRRDAVRIDEVMRHVVGSAMAALSCDLGVIYVADIDAVEVAAERDAEPRRGCLPAGHAGALRRGGGPPRVRPGLGDRAAPAPARCVRRHVALRAPDRRPALRPCSPSCTPRRGRAGSRRSAGRSALRLAESAEPLLRSALTLHELEAQLDRVGRDARIDPLTKLPNRRAWEEAIAAGRRTSRPASSCSTSTG